MWWLYLKTGSTSSNSIGLFWFHGVELGVAGCPITGAADPRTWAAERHGGMALDWRRCLACEGCCLPWKLQRVHVKATTPLMDLVWSNWYAPTDSKRRSGEQGARELRAAARVPRWLAPCARQIRRGEAEVYLARIEYDLDSDSVGSSFYPFSIFLPIGDHIEELLELL
jgi:hypothetical protein